MSPEGLALAVACERFPRVSGDEPTMDVAESEDQMFSPRERG